MMASYRTHHMKPIWYGLMPEKKHVVWQTKRASMTAWGILPVWTLNDLCLNTFSLSQPAYRWVLVPKWQLKLSKKVDSRSASTWRKHAESATNKPNLMTVFG